MRQESLWIANHRGPTYPRLDGNFVTDVAIVGGGIAGLSAAILLLREGRRVAIFEKGLIGHGESGKTSAHLTEVVDAGYQRLISDFGVDNAQKVASASRFAINQIESLCTGLKIDCGFRRVPGYLFTEKSDDIERLELEAEALNSVGIRAKLSSFAPLPFEVASAIHIPGQAEFSPMEYLSGLARYLSGARVPIFEHTTVHEIEDGDDEPCVLKTDQGTIRANEVIVAAHVPFVNRVFLHTKLGAYRTYVIAAKVLDAPAKEGLFWDTEDPYHYIRSVKLGGEDYLLVGGADHKVGREEHTEKHYESLCEYLESHFDVVSVDYQWSGQIIETVDRLPYIGRNSLSKHIYVATGFSGNGLTFGTVAGRILADAILEKPNDWSALFDATRVTPIASASSYVAENRDFPLLFVGDRLARSTQIEQLATGEGAVISVDGEKAAVYKMEDGGVRVLSAVCPHLKCLVRWNTAEKTWDCPCHGSRFDCEGAVLNGPAVSNLTPLEERSEKKGAA